MALIAVWVFWIPWRILTEFPLLCLVSRCWWFRMCAADNAIRWNGSFLNWHPQRVGWSVWGLFGFCLQAASFFSHRQKFVKDDNVFVRDLCSLEICSAKLMKFALLLFLGNFWRVTKSDLRLSIQGRLQFVSGLSKALPFASQMKSGDCIGFLLTFITNWCTELSSKK